MRNRLLLLVNHILSREPAATQRLRAYAGACVRIEVERWPSFLPEWPATTLAITPFGGFEVDEAPARTASRLTVRIARPDPAQLWDAIVSGAAPEVRIEGDAALAAEMRWLIDNVRWDIEADLAEAIGPAAAHLAMRLGRSAAAALRAMLPGLDAARR